jgi:CubicO group peptidase (beta-lactamase class C family)
MMKPTKTKPRLFYLVMSLALYISPVLSGRTSGRYFPDSPWGVSTPEEQGIDSGVLLEMFRNIQSSHDDFHSILIIRNGYLVIEAYWAPYHRSTTHNVKSASKSIMSALTGIALKEQYLKNLEQKVAEFFPEYVEEPQKANVSLRNMLTMTAGINWSEDSGPSPFDLDNWKKLPMIEKPGQRFVYNTMLTHMMSAIVTEVSGTSTRTFADKYLFQPLGITNCQWTKGGDGYYHGGSDIFLSPRDMAKFGYLYLNGGLWNGKQIVPEKWVKESTARQIPVPSELLFARGLRYGYWWWLPAKGYMAWGAGGQYIIVRPDLNLVVVITANGAERINLYKGFMEAFLEQNIIHAIKGNRPLARNPKANQDLNHLLQELENPEAEPVPSMPATAATVSNRNYIVDANELDFKSFCLVFNNSDECLWRLQMGQKTVTYHIGMDGRYRITRPGFSMGVNPDGEQVACRGYWKGDDTFLIEYHIIGDPSKQNFDIRFTEDKARIHLSTIGMDTVINGTAKSSE